MIVQEVGSALLVGAVYHHHPYQDGHGDSNEDGLGDDFNHYPTHLTMVTFWEGGNLMESYNVGDRNDCKQCH